MIGRVLAKTGEMVRSCGMIYKSVEQIVILYGSEVWVVTGEILKVLEVLHHREAQRIAGITDQHT